MRDLTRCFLELLRRPQAGQEQALVRLAQLKAGGTLAGQHQLGRIVDADEQSFRTTLTAEQGCDAVRAGGESALRRGLRQFWKRRLLAGAQRPIEQFDGAIGSSGGQRLFEGLADDRLSGCSDQAAKGRIHPTQQVLFTLGRGRGERQVFADQATERRQIDGETLGYRGGPLGLFSRRALTRQGDPQDA